MATPFLLWFPQKSGARLAAIVDDRDRPFKHIYRCWEVARAARDKVWLRISLPALFHAIGNDPQLGREVGNCQG